MLLRISCSRVTNCHTSVRIGPSHELRRNGRCDYLLRHVATTQIPFTTYRRACSDSGPNVSVGCVRQGTLRSIYSLGRDATAGRRWPSLATSTRRPRQHTACTVSGSQVAASRHQFSAARWETEVRVCCPPLQEEPPEQSCLASLDGGPVWATPGRHA